MMNNFTHLTLKLLSPLFLISKLVERIFLTPKTTKYTNGQTAFFSLHGGLKKLNLSFFIVVAFLMVGVNKVAGQITQVGTSTYAYGAGVQSVTLNKPAGIAIGDILVVSVSKYCAGNISDPFVNGPGWTMISSTGMNSGVNDVRGAVFYKVVDNDEYYQTNVTVVFESGWWPNVNNGVASLMAFTGVNAANPFDVTPGAITSSGGTGGYVYPASVTTTSPNALILMLGMNYRSAGYRSFTGWSVATSPALTEIADASASTTNVNVGAATGIKTTPGSTGAGTISFSGAGAYSGGLILALKPGTKQFRSKQNGPWNQAWVWEQSIDGGTTWMSATSIPDANSSVYIKSGDAVTVSSASANANDLTVDGALTVSGAYSLTLTATASINGTLTVQNTGSIVKGSGNIAFNSGSIYQHDRNAGTIPAAVWDQASTCRVTGMVANAPGGLTQSFGNLEWSCYGQTGNVSTNGNVVVNGNFILTAGTFTLNNANNYTLTILGDYTQTGGKFDFNRGTKGNSYVYVGGNLSNSAGTASITTSGSGAPNGVFIFNGSNIQTLNIPTTTAAQWVMYTINSGSSLKLLSNLTLYGSNSNTYYGQMTVNGTLDFGVYTILDGNNSAGATVFALNSGATLITANTAGINGSLPSASTTKTLNSGANYIYNGTAAQVTGALLTAANNLTINNAAGVILTNATSVSGVLTLSNGTLSTTASNLISVNNSSTASVVGGGSNTFINGPLAWSLPATTTGSTYNFPVGSGTTYLPFAISSPTTAATATVQAFVGASGGTANVNTASLSAKSNTEYWRLTPSSFGTSSISLGKGTTAIYPYDVIAGSTSLNGTYNNLAGTTGTYGVTGSNAIGTNQYFTLATSKAPKLNVSTTALSSFNYIYDFGPSALQSFTVSGNLLTSDVTITPPADYEISIDGGTTFSLTPLTALKTGVTTVYVRLKAGLAVGTYNAETITITTATSGVSAKTITCSGFVSATAPSIVAGGGIDCSTNSINLTSTYSSGVNNLYWTGPNSFYSTTQNPSIANATSVNEGTYIVTGNVLSGVNLITNGNFESGATGFTSGYSYKTPNGGGTLWTESTYTVAANPNAVHSNFSSCSDHTTGGTTPVGQQMIINGASAANISIWGQNVPVTPNTIYQFTYWVQSVTGTNPSQLQLYVNNASAGPTYTADASTCSWKKFVYNWNSGSATTANLSLVNQNTNGDGNDFALDDIDFEAVLQISSSVKVTLDKAPSLLIVTAAANPVAAGTNVTFSTIPTNGGTAPTFQWYVNGSLVPGATSPTYSYVPSDGDAVTCVMTPVGACVSAPVTSDPIVIMTVTSTPNYWIGTSSTNWSVPANWSNGVVPKSGDDVIFATTANNKGNAAQNDLYADANHTIGNLINASDKKLVIQPTQVIVVNQKITTSSADQIYIQSSPTQANGSLIFYNDQTTSPVLGTVEMYSKANYNATGVIYNGNTYNYTWQYFGIPIESITAEPTFYGSWVRKWDETGADMTTHWVQLGNADKVNPFYGYEITQQVATGKTIVFQGQLVNRNFTTPLLASTSTALFPGQHILANPYTAAIDIKKFLATNAGADFDGSVYLYSTGSYADWGNGGGQGSADGTSPGQYQAVNNMAGTGGLPSQIPSMQGFLVQVLTGSQPNSTITFNYNDVVKNSEQQRIRGTEALSAEDMISTKVEVKGANYSDKMWIFTDSTFTKKYDKGWDGTKIYGSALAPQLYAVGTDGIYQINAVNDLNNTTLGFERGVDSTYTFTFTHENVDRRYSGIYLVDSIEHKTINITASGSQYQFTVNKKGVYPNRFKIVTLKNEPTSPETSSKIDLFNFDNMIFVNNVTNEEGQFSLYDMSGRQISSSRFGPNSLNWVSSIPSQGIYIGKAITNSEKNTKRFIAKFRIRE